MLRAADIFLENGVYIETGPHKHAIQQSSFLYVYEPGGNRIEIANAGAELILAPDWKPIIWTEDERKKGQAWGLQTIESFHTPRHAGDSDATSVRSILAIVGLPDSAIAFDSSRRKVSNTALTPSSPPIASPHT